jgi:nicotinamide phosphoribosyltransferase
MKSIFAPRIEVLERSKANREHYHARQEPRFNLVLAVDSYKLSHSFAYPKNVCGMFSYIEARTQGEDIMIPFGRQALLQRYLSVPINQDDIDEAEMFAAAHGDPFNRQVWQHILHVYHGFMPLVIRGVPEGTPVRSSNAMTTIMCTDEFVSDNIFWLCSYFETLLVRGEWYPTAVATSDYKILKEIEHFYEVTGADKGMIPYSLHDFGGRGVTCHEQAQIGGAAHLVSFQGSDNIEGTMYANYWYREGMSSYSVPATEHSVQCAFSNGKAATRESELHYLKNTIESLGKRGGIVSIVIDGYDVYRAAEILCTELKDLIIDSGCKVVFRPDSGDMLEVVPRILRLQAATFGYTKTPKGFYKVNHVGVLQGDGVDSLAIKTLLGKVVFGMNFSADNVIFGSGGALLQKLNRDTYKVAQKASAILIRDEATSKCTWVGIAKDPITDPGKKSKEGVLSLMRSRVTGEQVTIRLDLGPVSDEFEDMMVDIYDHGNFYNETSLGEIRQRARS